ncbi:hypothetical protein SDC9_173037 [bioreactor metagenome]|uniref:Uncharacterized protein n=1 Tax=bioreactor metagenome TaxID=1076179 RepID=A0A645GG06_9ZZZZ
MHVTAIGGQRRPGNEKDIYNIEFDNGSDRLGVFRQYPDFERGYPEQYPAGCKHGIGKDHADE